MLGEYPRGVVAALPLLPSRQTGVRGRPPSACCPTLPPQMNFLYALVVALLLLVHWSSKARTPALPEPALPVAICTNALVLLLQPSALVLSLGAMPLSSFPALKRTPVAALLLLAAPHARNRMSSSRRATLTSARHALARKGSLRLSSKSEA